MKRTTNRFDKGPYGGTKGISGMRLFEGEDLSFQKRQVDNKATMNEWVREQKREKILKDQQEKEEQKQYDEETKAINRMRGMLEDENNIKRAQMIKQMQEENQKLALEKNMKEENEKGWHGNMDANEVARGHEDIE